MLADASGRSKRFSEDFLREFFSIISERLEDGESVKIKDLGTFRLSRVEPRKSVDVTTGKPMEISGHSKVVFIPSKEIAEKVNAPFEAFSSIEIGDDVDIEQLMTTGSKEILVSNGDDDDYEDEEIAISNESINSEGIVLSNIYNSSENKNESDESEEDDAPQDSETIEDDSELEESFETVKVGESEREEITKQVIEPAQESELSDSDVSEEPKELEESEELEDSEDLEDSEVFGISRKRNWVKGVLVCFVAAIVALFATFAVWYIFATNDFNKRFNRETPSMAKGPTEGFTVGKSLETSITDESENNNASENIQEETDIVDKEEVKNDIESEVPTAPSDAIVYDTISTTRYLTTMAKKHYGNYNLWPYIYEENKAKLGHPDRIRPGTPVVIPKLSKYGVDPTNAADIDKAKKMGIAIYAKYGKSI